MKKRLLLLLVTLALPCSPALADSCPATAADSSQVVQVMQTMYRSLMAGQMAGDLPAIKAMFTPDAYLFDGGIRYTPDSITSGLEALKAKGMVFVWSVTEPEVHVDCHSAWITYVNRGSITTQAGRKETSWLESAVLEKKDGVWRIRFFHSTQMPDAETPARTPAR